jgi:hypothetical protein
MSASSAARCAAGEPRSRRGTKARSATDRPSLNGLAKRVKRAAFGLRSFVHWRIRVLL